MIERHLVLERGFNSAYVKGFIKQFRRTLAFAELNGGDILEDSKPEEDPMTTMTRPVSTPVVHSPQPSILPARKLEAPEPADNRREIRLPHPAGDITIKGPFPMNSADWITFVTVLNAFKGWLVKDEPSTSSTALPPPLGRSLSDAQV